MKKYYKLAQKEYNNRHDWLGKEMYWELINIITFEHATKAICTNQNPFLENETREILLYLKIQTDQRILDNYCFQKKVSELLNFVISFDHRLKLKDSKKIGKYLDFASELKKTTVERKV